MSQQDTDDYSQSIYNMSTSLGSGGGTDTLTIGSGLSDDMLNISTVSVSSGYSNLTVSGDAIVDGNLTVKGKSIEDVISRIESRLAILHTNPELEEKWKELRELRERYIELEKDIIEKEKMWSTLNK